MTPSLIVGAALTVLLFLLAINIAHYFHERTLPQPAKATGLRERVKRFLITGTDTDLKLESTYLAYLLLVALFAPSLPRPGSDRWLLIVLAFLLGLHFRQWLSKWRLRNLSFFPILLESRFVYLKSFGDTAVILLNIALGAYLASSNISLAAAQFVGFVAHEISLESKKGRRLLTRKLYLFDLEGLSLAPDQYRQLLRAIGRYDFRRLHRLATEAKTRKDRILLGAFYALIRDDFGVFRGLMRDYHEEIQHDPDLLYYFGKALYILGDIDTARAYLKRGCDEHKSRLCVSYYALSLLADATERREIERVLKLFEEHTSLQPTSRGDMFLSAFHALSLAISTSRQPDGSAARLSRALMLIHQAFALNDTFLRTRDLGPLGRSYYRANDQIFLDIYGYIVFRMSNFTLAFRALHAAIADDDTYPWPYFHLALIYERLGRHELANALLLRIARHERSETVLKRLCLARLARRTAERATTAASPN